MELLDICPTFLNENESNLFVNALREQGIEKCLTNNEPLNSDVILRVGRAAIPDKVQIKKGYVHDVIYKIIPSITRSDRKYEKYFKVHRYYLHGDYCGTAVGVYRNTALTIYVERQHGVTFHTVASQIHSYCHRNEGLTEMGMAPEVDGSTLLFQNGTVCLKVIFADIAHGAAAELSKTAEFIYDMMLNGDQGEMESMRNALGEIKARFTNILPENWLAFIRFCKLWVYHNFNGFPSEAVECLNTRILVARYPKLTEVENTDYAELFCEFLLALCQKDVMEQLEAEIELPTTVFQSQKFLDSKNEKLKNYGLQPEIEVDWRRLKDKFRSQKGARQITSLFDPSYNIVAHLNTRQWRLISRAADDVLIAEEANDIGLATLFKMSYHKQIDLGKPNTVARKVISSLVFGLVAAVMSAVSFVLLWFTFVMMSCTDSASGEVDYFKVSQRADDGLAVLAKTSEWLERNDLAIISDSEPYYFFEDKVAQVMDFLADEAPRIWEARIDVEMRAQLAKFLDDSQEKVSELSQKSWTFYKFAEVKLHEIGDSIKGFTE